MFCDKCEGMGEIWNEKGEMVPCDECGGTGVKKEKRMFPRKDFEDERIEQPE
jgi:DnaJ-class molecular chaperone